MDKARKWTDKQLATMERKIERIYKQAEKEISKKFKAYMKESEKKIRPLESAYKKALKKGNADLIKEAEEKLKQARLAQTMHSSHYKNILNITTREMAYKNSTALAYINDQMPSIYRVNYNQVASEIEKYGFRFDIVDEATVKRRIKEGKIISHKKQLDFAKDVAWNKKFLNSQVLQGIIQGESMRDISNRIFPEIESKAVRKEGESDRDFIRRNKQSAIRNARTMVTQAENSGRLDSYKQLEQDGVILKKVWMSTPDDRTRPSHIDIDGEEQDIDKEFSNGCMYPADSNGPAEEVWQCRCTMVTDIIGFRGKDGKINYVDKSLQSATMHEAQMAEVKESQRKAESEGTKQQSENNKAEPSRNPADYNKWDEDKNRLEYERMNKNEEAERYIYDYYVGTGNSFSINKTLRFGSIDDLRDTDRKTIDLLQATIKNNQIDENVRAVRMIGERYMQNSFGIDERMFYDIRENFDDYKDVFDGFVGTRIKEKGMMSTSTDVDRNVFGSRNARLDILVPKGTNAYVTNNYYESEVIFGLDSEYEVLGFSIEKGKRSWEENKLVITVLMR